MKPSVIKYVTVLAFVLNLNAGFPQAAMADDSHPELWPLFNEPFYRGVNPFPDIKPSPLPNLNPDSCLAFAYLYAHAREEMSRHLDDLECHNLILSVWYWRARWMACRGLIPDYPNYCEAVQL